MPHSKKGKEERTMEPIGGVVIPSCGSSFTIVLGTTQQVQICSVE